MTHTKINLFKPYLFKKSYESTVLSKLIKNNEIAK